MSSKEEGPLDARREPRRASSRTRGSTMRRKRGVAIPFPLVLTMAAVASLAAAAQARAEFPCRLGPPGLAAEAMCSWWLKDHQPEVVDNSMCCRPLIQRATRKEDEALEHQRKALDPKLSSEERRREIALKHEAFNKRQELLAEFKGCVNAVISALNAQASTGASPAAKIGAACGCMAQEIGNVGWRCCEDLSRSKYQVDLNIRTDNTSPDHDFPFNCHYYTKNYISTVAPGAPYPERNLLSDSDCLRLRDRHGFKQVAGPAHVGDIVLTKQPNAIPGCDWAHSGIITAVGKDGVPKRVRQKDGPSSCVVDLSWDEFKRAWVDASGTSATILTLPGHAGSIP